MYAILYLLIIVLLTCCKSVTGQMLTKIIVIATEVALLLWCSSTADVGPDGNVVVSNRKCVATFITM